MHYPVIHSVLSPLALQKTLESHYAIPAIQQLDYYQAGLNDTYLITTEKCKYILRAYRKDWRSKSDICYEIDALNFLHENKIQVATPIKTNNNDFIVTVQAPEGLRYLVLFHYIDGKPPEYKKDYKQEAKIYGQAFGKLHQTLSSFSCTHSRFELDLDYLLKKPLKFIHPFLKHRASDWQYLIQLSDNLTHELTQLTVSEFQMGFCHGDLNTQNVHITKNTLGLFDFDCCGYGYHAADIAAFNWGTRNYKNKDKIWEYFIQAYLTENSLSETDIKSIPIFSKMRHIWHIGLHAQLSKDRGLHWINDEYFNQQIDLLKNWDDKKTNS